MPPSLPHTKTTASMPVLPQMLSPHVPRQLPTNGGINQSIKLSHLPSKISFGGLKRIIWCTTTAPTQSGIQLFHLSARETPLVYLGLAIDTRINRLLKNLLSYQYRRWRTKWAWQRVCKGPVKLGFLQYPAIE